MFRCHGCGAGGDVFSFVLEQAKCSFADAVKLLAPNYGPRLTFERAETGDDLLNDIRAVFRRYVKPACVLENLTLTQSLPLIASIRSLRLRAKVKELGLSISEYLRSVAIPKE